MVATDVVPSPSFQLSRIWPPIPYKVTMKSISIHIIYIIFGKSLIFCCWKYLTCSRCNSKPIVKRVNAQNSKVSISTSVEEELGSKLNSLQRGIFHSFEAFKSKNLKKNSNHCNKFFLILKLVVSKLTHRPPSLHSRCSWSGFQAHEHQLLSVYGSAPSSNWPQEKCLDFLLPDHLPPASVISILKVDKDGCVGWVRLPSHWAHCSRS